MASTGTLRAARLAAGWTATALAEALGVSRQTVHAIETGRYVPNTLVALKLARLLGRTVEELFGERDSPPPPGGRQRATLLGNHSTPPAPGDRVQTWQVDDRWFATAVLPYPAYLPVVDRVAAKHGASQVSVDIEGRRAGAPVIIAGCDPALSLLARALEARQVSSVLLPAASRTALRWLQEGRVDIAGTHLHDEHTGQFNLPFIDQIVGTDPVHVVTFAEWEEGLAVRPRHPARIRSMAALANSNVRIVNRESGSGARALLDASLAAAGLPSRRVRGYTHVVHSHLEATALVAGGGADCCVAGSAAAEWFGLRFIPLQVTRFDLVMRQVRCQEPRIRAVLDALNDAPLRRGLTSLAGYRTTLTGTVVRP